MLKKFIWQRKLQFLSNVCRIQQNTLNILVWGIFNFGVSMIRIRVGNKDDVDFVQNVFNHRDIIGWLGGFTLRENLVSKLAVYHRPSLFVAEKDFQIVGAAIISSRAQSHYFKFGEIGVLPEYRRCRIASSLYAAMTFQCILEGRRLGEDSIVGDNPIQFDLLPTIGLVLSGLLKHKTASAKDIGIFQLDLLDTKVFDILVNRILDLDINIELVQSFYQQELWLKNMDIIQKKIPDFEKVIYGYRDFIYNMKNITTKRV